MVQEAGVVALGARCIARPPRRVERPQWTFDESRLRPAWTRVSCSLPRPNEKATATGGLFIWWRWRELNPRPKAIDAQSYMLSPPLDLVIRQHGVRSAPVDQSGRFRRALSDRRFGLSPDNDGTSTSKGTSGFPAYALSGESVVVVVGN